MSIIRNRSSQRLAFFIIAVPFIPLECLVIGGARGDSDADGAVMQLTFGECNDGGAIALADDGTTYFVFGSKRAGNVDIWMKSSKDGINWSAPRPVVQTPIDDLMGELVRTSDGRYHLTGRRAELATWDSSSSDLVNWTEPVRWTDPGARGIFERLPTGIIGW